jgi:hypothetical protein
MSWSVGTLWTCMQKLLVLDFDHLPAQQEASLSSSSQ